MNFFNKTLLMSLATLTMIVSAADAQNQTESKDRVRIGVRAGVSSIMTFGSDDFDHDWDEDDWDEDWDDSFKDRALPAFRAGVSVTLPIAKNWGVETGAYYQQYGGTNKRQKFDHSKNFTQYDNWTVKTRLNGISIPVMGHYGRQFGKQGLLYWDAFAGPYARFLFSGEAKATHKTSTVTKTSSGTKISTYSKTETTTDALDVSEVYDLLNAMNIHSNELKIKKTGAGFLFGGGVTFFNHLYAGMSFDFGFSPVMKFSDDSRPWNDEYSMRLSAFSFNVGYTF